MGKTGSKLKKMRSRSITWNFRFPSLSRQKMSGPHLDISQWLAIMDLKQYYPMFDKFTGVEELLQFTEIDIKDLGVKNSAHRARIVSSLVALRAKYEKCSVRKDKSQRHSVAVDAGRSRLLVDRDGKSDILVVSDVTQSKSLCNLPMEANPDPGADPVQLRKALEWELSLDSRDLRSHAWYHGGIPRHRAEEIVEKDGDFLVRDCTSQPGNYVLTCRCKTQPLHFVINKVIIQPDTVYERIQYRFEDDAYDAVPDLVTFYVGSGKPISSASGARITTPKNRLYPLSFYATKYGIRQQSPLTSHSPYNSYLSPVHSPPRAKRDVPPKLPNKKQRSLSLTPAEMDAAATIPRGNHEEKSSSADGVVRTPMVLEFSKFSTHSLPRNSIKPMSSTLPHTKNGKMVRVTSDPALSPCMERRRFACPLDGEMISDTPPPKPSRIPSLIRSDSKDAGDGIVSHHGTIQRVASGSDSGNASGDSAQSGDATEPLSHRGVIIKNPRYQPVHSVQSNLLVPMEYEDSVLLSTIGEPDIPVLSAFDLENFQTLLLPTLENKPLDATALQGVKMMLQETGSRIIANHLTRVDLGLTSNAWDHDLGYGITCGLQLCMIPHGQSLRRELIERSECLKLLVAVTVLTSPTEVERAEILNKWIQVAIDTKTALGNLYGFAAIMLGLCMPQVQRLTSTWHVLRQKFTDAAFNFEAKLRPTLKSMNECTNPQAPNTTIPHILPFLLLQERTLEEILGTCPGSYSSIVNSCLSFWEMSTPDFGLATTYAHLETARKFGESLNMFRRNAEIVLADAKIDDLLTDAFRTEFQLKFLWGSRGATVTTEDRHAKFEKVLNVMSDKCEPAQCMTTAV